MKGIWTITKTAIPLWLGAAAVLYAIAAIDIAMRLDYWASSPESPNMDPRIMYSFALLGLIMAALVSGIVEILRQWVFERRQLRWWQLGIVGSTYPIYFSSVALRHAVGNQTAEILSIVLVVFLNPLLAYWMFRGYSQSHAA